MSNGTAFCISPVELLSPQENTFVATKYRGMSAENVLSARHVLIRPVCAEEFWPAAAIQRFTQVQYFGMKRKRKIWAVGSFAAMKREYNLLKNPETKHSCSN